MTSTVRGQRGFTVAELLVSAAVIAFIMAGLFSLLLSGQQTYLTGSGRAEGAKTLPGDDSAGTPKDCRGDQDRRSNARATDDA